MAFLGVAGQADADSFAEFVATTGTEAFPHINDEDGTVWQQFGVNSRSTFLFINDDGSTEIIGYGVANEQVLADRVESLISS